jgi:hypothetical protein
MNEIEPKITSANYRDTVLVFRDRQAGIGEVYDPETETYTYNAYCLEKKLLKELWTSEFSYLDDALGRLNEEFGTWEKEDFEEEKGCGSCVAK